MLKPHALSLSCVLMFIATPEVLAQAASLGASERSREALSAELGLALPAEDRSATSTSRLGLYESAHMLGKGQGAWTSLDLGLHRVDYALNDHLQFGVTMALPIGFFAIMPELKVGGTITGDLHGSLAIRVATVIAPASGPVIGYGGHGALTYGSPDLHLTLGVQAYGVSLLGMEDPIGWLVHPSLGGVARVSDFALLHLDLGPVVTGSGFSRALCTRGACAQNDEAQAELWVIKYGVRFHGEAWFGDVSFAIPAHESWREIATYLPMGLPTLTLGYAF